MPDGSPCLGITLRQYDVSKRAWIIDYVNVTNSFLRRQVDATSGSVGIDGETVVVISEGPDTWSRETYRVESSDYVTAVRFEFTCRGWLALSRAATVRSAVGTAIRIAVDRTW